MKLSAGICGWVVRHPVLVVAVLLVCLVCTAYAGSLANDAVWDDSYLVTDNPYLRSFEGLRTLVQTDLWTASGKREPSSFYRPLTMVSFWLNAKVGQSPAVMRAGNILLHALDAVLLFIVLRKLLQPSRTFVAAMLAMTWAVMGVNSEPVFWISGRFDPLVVLAALLCMLGNRLTGWRQVVVVLSSVVGGLLSKEAFVGWLPMILLDDILLLRRPVRQVWPKYVGVGVSLLIYLGLRRVIGIVSLSVVSETGVMRLAEAYLFTFATLVWRMFVPVGLDAFHPYAPLPVLHSIVLVVGLVSVSGVLVWRALRRGASHAACVTLFGWCWLLLCLVPPSVTGPNLFMIGDRYAYLPGIGLLVMGFGLLAPTMQRLGCWRPWAVLLGGAVFVVYGIGQAWALVARTDDWRNDRTLAEASIRAHPDNPYSLYVLGRQALDEGALDRAEALLVRAERGNVRSWRTPNALCVLWLRRKQYSRALDACHQSLELHPENPRAWVNLASVHVQLGHWDHAFAAAGRSLEIKPHYAEGRYLAAVSAANLGRMAEAHEHLRAGLKEDPKHRGLMQLKRQMDQAR